MVPHIIYDEFLKRLHQIRGERVERNEGFGNLHCIEEYDILEERQVRDYIQRARVHLLGIIICIDHNSLRLVSSNINV